MVVDTFRQIEREDGTLVMLMTWYVRKREKTTVLQAYSIYHAEVAAYNYRYRNDS